MYQGKFSNQRPAKGGRFSQRRNRGHKRSLLLMVSVFTLIFAMVGGTLAYLATNTAPVVNTFSYGEVPNTIPEEINGDVKSNVRVTNNGNIDAFVRAQIVVTWKDQTGKVSATFPVKDTDYTMNLNLTDWFQGADGFYYCKARVKPGADTAYLITEAKNLGHAPEGYDLSIEILAQTCQADGTTAEGAPLVTTIWNNVKVVNGSLAKK